MIDRGREMWGALPVLDMILRREELQEGMQAHAELLANYEIAPGRRLIDTRRRNG